MIIYRLGEWVFLAPSKEWIARFASSIILALRAKSTLLTEFSNLAGVANGGRKIYLPKNDYSFG